MKQRKQTIKLKLTIEIELDTLLEIEENYTSLKLDFNPSEINNSIQNIVQDKMRKSFKKELKDTNINYCGSWKTLNFPDRFRNK